MQAFILGLVVIALAYLAQRSAKRPLRYFLGLLGAASGPILGGLVLALSAWLVVRGSLVLALVGMVAGIWLISGQGLPTPTFGPSPARPEASGKSSVATEHLEMVLDHQTGEMRGRIRKGFFQGRRIETLRPVELAHLWQDCRFVDPQSAQLVEAYLDRLHPSWREDMARAEAGEPKGPDGRMTRAEALEILGMEGEPDVEAIRRAHRELMLRLHPDRGGSTYLAAKVNEAKAVLLDRET